MESPERSVSTDGAELRDPNQPLANTATAAGCHWVNRLKCMPASSVLASSGAALPVDGCKEHGISK